MIIEWKEKYRVGIDIIDEQHKKLFETAGKIYDLLNNDIYTDKYDRIVELIYELKDYALYHFKTEEEYMQKIGYRKFLSHKVYHDDFVEKINSIDLESIDQDHDAYLLEMLEFVVNWIDEHILKNDKQITSEVAESSKQA